MREWDKFASRVDKMVQVLVRVLLQLVSAYASAMRVLRECYAMSSTNSLYLPARTVCSVQYYRCVSAYASAMLCPVPISAFARSMLTA